MVSDWVSAFITDYAVLISTFGRNPIVALGTLGVHPAAAVGVIGGQEVVGRDLVINLVVQGVRGAFWLLGGA